MCLGCAPECNCWPRQRASIDDIKTTMGMSDPKHCQTAGCLHTFGCLVAARACFSHNQHTVMV